MPRGAQVPLAALQAVSSSDSHWPTSSQWHTGNRAQRILGRDGRHVRERQPSQQASSGGRPETCIAGFCQPVIIRAGSAWFCLVKTRSSPIQVTPTGPVPGSSSGDWAIDCSMRGSCAGHVRLCPTFAGLPTVALGLRPHIHELLLDARMMSPLHETLSNVHRAPDGRPGSLARIHELLLDARMMSPLRETLSNVHRAPDGRPGSLAAHP